jgi:hypothetical protein
MTVTEEITRELMLTDTVVEATVGGEGMRRYALEAGARICMIPAVQAAQVDSAELIGFIRNAITADATRGYDVFAEAIATRFELGEE